MQGCPKRAPHPGNATYNIPLNSIFNSWKTRPNAEAVEKLVFAQAHEMDPEKRRDQLGQLHQLLRDEPGGISLFGLNQVYAMRDRIDYSWIPGEALPLSLEIGTLSDLQKEYGSIRKAPGFNHSLKIKPAVVFTPKPESYS